MQFKRLVLLWVVLIVLLGLSACQSGTEEAVGEVTEAPAAEPVVAEASPTALPTEAPQRSLVICLGEEPRTLYMYGGSSEAMWSVLEAVYDGPIDQRGFLPQPVILSKMPDVNDGDAAFFPVDVQTGQWVVDVNGELQVLEDGMKVLPSGCESPDCAQAWDSNAPFQMDKLVVRFSILPGITWSDGTPMTTADSVFSYQVSADPETPVSKKVVQRTLLYQALDDQTLQWEGVPGYFPAQYESLFWYPLPNHLLSQYTPAQLLQAEETAVKPIGWGPYMISEWVTGDHITLVKNPNYFRAAEGLPKFDTLVYRFLSGTADSNLAALSTGECDITDRTADLDEQIQGVRQLELDGTIKMHVGEGPEWEQMVFGVNPVSYDDGFNLYTDRVDYFSDVRVRQAITHCMNRELVLDAILFGNSSQPTSYLPPSHPYYANDLPWLAFDLAEGARLLDEAGWLDLDGDPSTPRQASGIPTVLDGTPLVLNYATTGAVLRQEVVQIQKEYLAQCGIELNVTFYDPLEIYAPGPDGVLFGRNFDLAEMAWKAGIEPPCAMFSSEQVPTEDNKWLGINVSGYQNEAFDAACQASLAVRSYQDGYTAAQQEVQRLFAQELPAVPLYYRLKVLATRPDMCGVEMDVSARSDLWNLEMLDYGEGCQ